MKATILYTLLRIGLFLVLFAALNLTSIGVYLAAIAAAILALLISYLFFGRLRRGVADTIVRRRQAPERDEDADLEDSVLDGPSTADGLHNTESRRPAAPATRPARQQAPGEDD